jgi:GT2 family glycosyltransferase
MDSHVDYEHLLDTRLDIFRKLVRKGSISRSGYGGFLLVNRDAFIGIGGFDELYDAAWGADDSDIVDRLYKYHEVSGYKFLDISYVDGVFVVHQWHQPRQDREGTMLNRLRYDSVRTVERNLEGFGQLEVVEL